MKTEKILDFFANISRTDNILSRKLEWPMNGISWTEFLILRQIFAKNGKIRRIDLAENIGLTASGITRILLPMEKIGLVSRQNDENDKRVSFVILTEAGKIKFYEAKSEVLHFFEKILLHESDKNFENAEVFVNNFSKNL